MSVKLTTDQLVQELIARPDFNWESLQAVPVKILGEAFCEKKDLQEFPLHDVLNAYDVIAYTVWVDEDIAGCLEEDGYKPNAANIAEIRNSRYLRSLGDCNDQDWDLIHFTIGECRNKLEKEEKFEGFELFDRNCLYSGSRLAANGVKVPEGLYVYQLRHGDDDSYPCAIEERVVVNHWGDIITAEPIDLGPDKYLPIDEDDWSFTDEEMSMDRFLEEYKITKKEG